MPDEHEYNQYVNGFMESTIDYFVDLAKNEFNQRGDKLKATLHNARLAVKEKPELMPDEAKRQRFEAQRDLIAAASICTTICRWLWLYMSDKISSNITRSLSFTDYYIAGINDNAIGYNQADKCFNWIIDEKKLIEPYVSHYDYWEFSRKEFGNDQALLDELYKVDYKVVLVRKGPSASKSTHTFCALLDDNNDYRIIDTYYPGWCGRILEERFGPRRKDFLHYLYGYEKY
jgi:hypothetical protein